MKVLLRFVQRLLRGPRASAWLKRFGINPVQYWLLMDLFAQLSERREVLSQLGREGTSLKIASWLYFAFSGLMALPFVLMGRSPLQFFVLFMFIGAFMLLSMLLPETSNSLVNPVEGLVLAHQPVDGATYTAAKLSHIGVILLYLVPGLNTLPAFAALLLPKCPWYYPLLHMAAAFAVGIVLALSCCALFGWLIRFMAPARLKRASFVAEMTPWLGYVFFQFASQFHVKLRLPRWVPTHGGPLYATIAAMVLLAIAAVVLGLRALSGDYLVRVSAIAHGGSGAKTKVRRSRSGALVSLLCGGPPARAGFAYLSLMMRRDWQFRRQLLALLPLTLMGAMAAFQSKWITPFSGKFTGMHLLPHAFGFGFFLICSALVYGSDYKGAWLFLLAPMGSFHGFARGVYARLLLLMTVPQIVLLPALAWKWGIRDGALFIAYSMAAAAVYIACELRLIEGMPFSRQPQTASNPYIIPIMLIGGFVVALAVGAQILIFHSRLAVLVVSVVLAVAAWLVTRASLDTFEIAIRFHLGILSSEAKAIYTEIEA